MAPVCALADRNPGAHSRKCEVPLAGKRLDVVRKLRNTLASGLVSILYCWDQSFISRILEAGTNLSTALEVR